jgi:hypothetical protein
MSSEEEEAGATPHEKLGEDFFYAACVCGGTTFRIKLYPPHNNKYRAHCITCGNDWSRSPEAGRPSQNH